MNLYLFMAWQTETLPALVQPSYPVQPYWDNSVKAKVCGNLSWSFASHLCWGLVPFDTLWHSQLAPRAKSQKHLDVLLVAFLPYIQLHSEAEVPYSLFRWYFYLFCFFWIDITLAVQKATIFMSGKMWSIWALWAPIWAQTIWQILKREHVAWIINQRNLQRFGLASLTSSLICLFLQLPPVLLFSSKFAGF